MKRQLNWFGLVTLPLVEPTLPAQETDTPQASQPKCCWISFSILRCERQGEFAIPNRERRGRDRRRGASTVPQDGLGRKLEKLTAEREQRSERRWELQPSTASYLFNRKWQAEHDRRQRTITEDFGMQVGVSSDLRERGQCWGSQDLYGGLVSEGHACFPEFAALLPIHWRPDY